MRFTRPLVLPARVGVYVTNDGGIWVGDAPGGRRLPRRTLRDGGRRIMSDFLLELPQEPERAHARPDAGAADSRCPQALERDARALAGAAAGRRARRRRRGRRRRARRGARRVADRGRRRRRSSRCPGSLAAPFRARRRDLRPSGAARSTALAEGKPLNGARLRRHRRRSTRRALRALYDFFQPLVRSSRARAASSSSARAAEDTADPAQAAAQAALDGFVRSVAKEIGRIGATANLVLVDADGAETPPRLRCCASSCRRASAFVTGAADHA